MVDSVQQPFDCASESRGRVVCDYTPHDAAQPAIV